MSVVSSTDEQLFRQFANAETVDTTQGLNSLEEVLEVEEDDFAPPKSPSPPRAPSPIPSEPAAPARSFFDEAVTQRMVRSAPSVTSVASHKPWTTAPPTVSAPQWTPPPAPMSMRMDEDQMLAKQSALLDLDRLRLRGVTLTREYTLADSLDDMTFELKRHLAHIDEESSVSMMRDFLRVACTGIEMGSTRLGVLELEGWSAEVCDDIRKYDPALSGLYRKYFRRGSTASPEMQLMMGMVGSIGLFHVKKKVLRSVSGAPRGGGGGMGGGGMGGLGGLAGMFAGMAAAPPRSNGPLFSADSDTDDEAAPIEL